MPRTERHTPEQVTWSIPLGAAILKFHDGAQPEDFRLRDELIARLDKTIVNLPVSATRKHLGMAVLTLAMDLVEAEVEREHHDYGNKLNAADYYSSHARRTKMTRDWRCFSLRKYANGACGYEPVLGGVSLFAKSTTRLPGTGPSGWE
jgi:hypothetical protein